MIGLKCLCNFVETIYKNVICYYSIEETLHIFTRILDTCCMNAYHFSIREVYFIYISFVSERAQLSCNQSYSGCQTLKADINVLCKMMKMFDYVWHVRILLYLSSSFDDSCEYII